LGDWEKGGFKRRYRWGTGKKRRFDFNWLKGLFLFGRDLVYAFVETGGRPRVGEKYN